jgi:hypothetical protein
MPPSLRFFTACGFVLGIVGHSTLGRAEQNPTSYGEQTLLADGASGALLMAGILAHDSPTANLALGGSGVAGYAFATPILHAVHGRWDSAGISLGLRAIGVPLGGLLGGLAGVLACSDHGQLVPSGCFAYGGQIGAGMSAALISVVDAVFLAREAQRVGPPPRVAPKPSFRVTPSVDAAGRGAGIGILGRF